jgi:hypothetical protein
MTNGAPRLKLQGLGIDLSLSKISRPATWITQEVIRKLALHSFKSSILCSKRWSEFASNPSSNHWLNWPTSRYDDALLRFAIDARLRQRWAPSAWNVITVQRQDSEEFRVEDQANYSIAVVYHPDLDTRRLTTLRIDALDRSFILPDVRIEEDPIRIVEMLSEKYGFQIPKAQACHFEDSGRQIKISTRIPMAFGSVNLPHYTRRSFQIYLADDPWWSGDVLSLASDSKEQIWARDRRAAPLAIGSPHGDTRTNK